MTSLITEPPKTFLEKLKFLGPGFILSASIIGSGELIATTALGAKAGFITFWVIIVSCLVKVAIQLEFGKHAILYGETAMTSFNKLPGKRFGKAHWSVWTFLFLMVIKVFQLGGIIGGVALAFNIAIPGIPVWVFAILAGLGAALIVFKGIYGIVEKFSLLMMGLFTILTFVSLYFVQYTDFAITWGDISSGLSFHLPKEAVIFAIGAFGLTGVGGDEIIHYTYWCSEKGYSSFTGPMEENETWQNRAKGWIKIMQLDALVAMIVYTLVTAAFYLLGAAVLHGKGEVPQGMAMIETLSNIYTDTLGPQAKIVFLIGAIIVLFSTLFAALAAWTRQYSDIFGAIGWIDYNNLNQRKRSIAILAFALPAVWVILFLFIQLPALMVIFGGIITSIILLLVVYAAIHFRMKQTPKSFRPTIIYDLSLLISIFVILGVAVYGVIKLF